MVVGEHDVVLANTRALAGAAYYGRLSLMEWLMDQHGCLVNARACDNAVRCAVETGSLDAAEWLLQRHFFVSPELHFARFNYREKDVNNCLKVMRWLREVANCPWDATELAYAAACCRDLESLKYIHQHGSPFNAEQLHDQLQASSGRPGGSEVAEWLRTQRAE